ncbi:glycosyltransferase family 9 protein [Thiohalophilus sp.]|uniref:glycosyltransferase family 9 protein n=1 Tax=Thiohalophilus sp. TaxID=3028392 RepID=UPI002ACE675E|nr:glycosyltransferase family 9 protein [Thiohalophilus sp.]MDZ7663543.1 glycosyltransferase family 9 protein [Thiohalophilus sp.]
MPLPFSSPPNNLCILRLSAIGDICHTLPVVRTIQQAWPQTRLTWIIGKSEYALLEGIVDIEFVVFDKSAGMSAYRDVRRQLNSRAFDALLHMQMSLRSSLLSLLVNSPVKLGFDRDRAGDMQWLFSNHKIAPQKNQHVLDSLFGFSQALGIREKQLRWDIPVTPEDMQLARQLADPAQPYLVISPSSSKPYRNWHTSGYAQLADHAANEHGLRVYITGGNTPLERQLAEDICTKSTTDAITNLAGKTSLKQLLVVLQNALGVIAPDSGPAHMATAVGTPVIGLYACTNPDRARPYLSAEWTVNRYPEAVQARYHKPVEALPWGLRVRDAGTMDRISVEEVKSTLDRLIHASGAHSSAKDNTL